MGENPIDKIVREGLNELPTSAPSPIGWAETLSTVKASGALGGASATGVLSAISGKVIIGSVVVTGLVTTAVIVYPESEQSTSQATSIDIEQELGDVFVDEEKTAKYEDHVNSTVVSISHESDGVSAIVDASKSSEGANAVNESQVFEAGNKVNTGDVEVGKAAVIAKGSDSRTNKNTGPSTLAFVNDDKANDLVSSKATLNSNSTVESNAQSNSPAHEDADAIVISNSQVQVDANKDINHPNTNSATNEESADYEKLSANESDKPGFGAANSFKRNRNERVGIQTESSLFKIDVMATPLDVVFNAPTKVDFIVLKNDSAHEKSIEPNRPSKVSIMPYISVDNSIVDFKVAQRYRTVNGALLTTAAERQLHYSIGARLIVQPLKNPNLNVHTGLYYMNKGSFSGAMLTASESMFAEYQLDVRNIEIPLLVSYRVPRAGFGIQFLTGIHVQRNLASKTNFIREFELNTGELTSVAFNTGSTNLAFVGAIGIDVKVARDISFYVEPSYRVSTGGLVNILDFSGYELPVDPEVNSFGLGAGVIFKL